MISIIICTYNRDKFIEDALKALVQQTLSPSDYEVIVVNNNCTDQTTEIVNAFIENHPNIAIRQIFESNQGLSFARNKGLQEAKYDVVSYIDDDGIAEPKYLEKIVRYFEEHPEVVGIGGKVIPIYEVEEPAWYNPFLRMMVTAIDFGDKTFKCKGKKYPAGCSMTYRKQLLLETGGFNNALKWRADDKYIFHQVSKISDEIYYYPEIKVGHHIDKARTTDENFDRLSRLLGSEERLRISSSKEGNYWTKLLEFIFKYFASILIALFFTLKGQWIKGKYIIRFRYLALLGFIQAHPQQGS